MTVFKGVNLALRFVLELCLLGALGYWGFRVGGGTIAKFALGLGAPLLMAVIWGMFMSPKARVRLSRPIHLAAEVAIFGLGVAVLFATGHPWLAWIFAGASVLSRALIFVWKQESISHGR